MENFTPNFEQKELNGPLDSMSLGVINFAANSEFKRLKGARQKHEARKFLSVISIRLETIEGYPENREANYREIRDMNFKDARKKYSEDCAEIEKSFIELKEYVSKEIEKSKSLFDKGEGFSVNESDPN